MKRLTILIAWLLLLVPTLVIGGIALRLLMKEQEEIGRAARAAAMEHAEAVAQSIDIAVTDVQDGLQERLAAMPADPRALEEELESWRRTNPLVRNVFVYRDGDGLLLPEPGRPSTDDEARFLERFDALFSGRVAWGTPELDAVERGRVASPGNGYAGAQAAAMQDSPGRKSRPSQSRKELWQLTQSRGPQSAAGDIRTPAETTGEWVPWIYENQVSMLGWIEREGTRHGLELEVMVLLARLLDTIPDPAYEDGVFALLDGKGQIMHQRGASIIEEGTPRLVSIQIGETLPHWQVSIFNPAGGDGLGEGGAFRIVSALLVATFVAAILLGGSLLLWQANRNLLDAQRKTTFVSNVSHELKTPLTSIRMYAELLGEGRVADKDKKKKYLRVIIDESRRLTRLVNNVLDFSRLEQGRKSYSFEELDLNMLMMDLLEMQQVRFREEGMELNSSVPDRPVPVVADRDALEQVILNLLDNALKYAGEGGNIDVDLTGMNGKAEIRIGDRGPGVPAAHRERIFEKFHRVDDSLTARQPGSGLGLSIARRILRDHGGDLTFRPRDGGGAIFIVSLKGKSKEDGVPS
jgi:signal transduction histidine kinase